MAYPSYPRLTTAMISMRLCYHRSMYLARSCVATAIVAVIVLAPSTIPYANAQEAETISSEQRDAARRAFERGEVAFAAGDFALAANSFEEAYRHVPHYASLWNAARSWERAGEQTRAANGYAKYLRSSPADAPDRDSATAALAALAEKLGRIEVYAAGVDTVRIDDEALDGTSIYVHPGMHVIEGQTGDTKIRRTEMVEAATVRSVALVEGPPTIAKGTPAADSMAPNPVPPKPKRLPSVSPISVYSANRSYGWLGPAAIVAGGVTVTVASLVLWSGVDTLSARRKFDAAPSEERLAAGLDKQWRTNVLIGGAIGSGVVTAALISLWKWNGSTQKSAVSASLPIAGSPMQVVLRGSF
jgi:tetratricopeptide (TPR) repeat protein